jgi:hypothetical protein
MGFRRTVRVAINGSTAALSSAVRRMITVKASRTRIVGQSIAKPSLRFEVMS